MAIGMIGSSGRGNNYVDYNVTITAQTSGTDNWTLDTTAGATCYTQTVLAADIDANVYIDGATDYYVLPNPGTITEANLDKFSWLSATESVTGGIKFYSMTGKPSFDIPVTIRIIK